MNVTINPNFWNDLFFIGLGFLFFVSQMTYEAWDRKEKIDWKRFLMKLPGMLIGIVAINALGPNLPQDYIPWSPATCLAVGYMPFEILSGIIRFKTPADLK